MTPGQLGPTIRVLPAFWAYAKNSAVSWTGMPSVITTTRGSPASAASTTAPLANGGGTKMTETSAAVSATASLTVPKTGSDIPPKSRCWPALRGLVPPTIRVPALSIRWVCLRPSEPVMPWTRTLLLSVRKIATVFPPLSRYRAARELGRAVRGAVHRVHHLDDVVLRLVEDPAPDGGVVAVEPYDQRLGNLLALRLQHVDCLDDAVRDFVAGGD